MRLVVVTPDPEAIERFSKQVDHPDGCSYIETCINDRWVGIIYTGKEPSEEEFVELVRNAGIDPEYCGICNSEIKPADNCVCAETVRR